MPHNVDKIMKGIKIDPTAISLCRTGKNGMDLLFWKSDDIGGRNMPVTMSTEAKEALKTSRDLLKTFGEQVPESIMKEIEKSIQETVTKSEVEALLKSNGLDPEVQKTLEALVKSNESTAGELKTVREMLEKRDKEDKEAKEIELKKSCVEFEKTLDGLPKADIQVSDLLYAIETSNLSPEHIKSVKTLFEKSAEAVKAIQNTDPSGKESGKPDTASTASGDGKAFAETLQKALDGDTSSATREDKLVTHMTALRKSDQKGYEEYERLVNEGQLKQVA